MEKLWPNRRVLAEAGKAELAKLRAAEVLDRSQFEVLGTSGGDLLTTMEKEMRHEGDDTQGLRLVLGWNPVIAARSYQQMWLARTSSVQQIGKRAMLESLVPREIGVGYAENGDPIVQSWQHNEVIIVQVSLKDGIWVPARIEWLRRK